MVTTYKKVPEVITSPYFLRFVQIFIDKFLKGESGLGRWIKEWDVMIKQGLLKPKIVRALYIKILTGKAHLNFHVDQVIYYIGINAQDAAACFIDEKINSLYEIRVITGELMTDDDDEPYTKLEYEEAKQICEALNEEAEEELFVIHKI